MASSTVGEMYGNASHFASDFNYEVQRVNHFEVSIDLRPLNLADRLGGGEVIGEHLRLSTKSISAPKVTAEAIELRHGNDRVKVAAAPQFEDLTLVVYDTIGMDQIQLVQGWFDHVFNHNTRLMGVVSDYKTTGTLYMYAPDCSIIRKWNLFGIWPKEFGVENNFAYDSTDAQTVTMTLSVDRYYEDFEIKKSLLNGNTNA